VRTPDLTALLKATGPFTSVAMDVTASDRANRDDLDLRWRGLQEDLLAAGAPERTVELVRERLLAGTGLGGAHTRWVVATDEVVADKVLPGRPARDERAFGPVPLTLPVLRAWARFLPYAVVRLDRAGADIEVVADPELAPVEESVEGGHDLLHKVPGGGFSQKRYQASVEDSWEHNASAVAEELDSVWRRHRPEVFVVGGDDHALGYLREHAGAEVRARLVRADGVGRADGVDETAEAGAIDEVVTGRRSEDRDERIEEFEAQRATQQRSVDGLAAVVDVLRRGQAETLLLRDDPTSTLELWVSSTDPLSLATTREEAGEDAERVRADLALPWAVVGSSAELLLVEDNPVALDEGVGALLRWSDQATPHERVPAMPGHGEAPGTTENTE